MDTIKWGILGTGYAASQFAQGLRDLPKVQLLAIGSRKSATAEVFAGQFNVPRQYDSYEKLVEDKEIDLVYIATPNAMHKEHCLLCLEAGKAVLCEKPFAINAQEAREVIELARQKQIFCMEAMWTRFLPLIQTIPEILKEGLLGEPQMFMADFGLRTPFNQEDRHFNPTLGGGALLDLGIYPISLAFYLLGPPSEVVSQCSFGKTGVDEQSSVTFRYSSGTLALLSSSFLTTTANEAILYGTHGQLRIHAPIYRPCKLSMRLFPERPWSPSKAVKPGRMASLKPLSKVKQLYDNYLSPLIHKPSSRYIPYEGNGYNYEAVEAMKCLKNGECESKIMPLGETLAILETLDIIRAQWNSKSPH